VNRLRTISTRSLVALVLAALAAAVGGTALALAAAGTGPTPPAEPLDQAIHDAVAGAAPSGITARITFTNRLFPSGALLGQAGSALMSGGSGRLWLTGDGRGRIELQSDAGDVQIVWDTKQVSVYDASSNTVYRADLPASTTSSPSTTDTPPALARIDDILSKLGAHWAIDGAQPTNVGGQPAYSATLSPKESGGLLGSLELAWDAQHGVPLRIGIYARGDSSPVLELAVDQISLGPVASSDVAVSPPATAKVTDLGGSSTTTGTNPNGETPTVTGLAAVQAAAPFPVVVPGSAADLNLTDVRLVGGKTVVAVYGDGLGSIALVERQAATAAADQSGALASLPTVPVGSATAHELVTPLGTVLEWQSGGTSFVLAGSVTKATAETAARSVG